MPDADPQALREAFVAGAKAVTGEVTASNQGVMLYWEREALRRYPDPPRTVTLSDGTTVWRKWRCWCWDRCTPTGRDRNLSGSANPPFAFCASDADLRALASLLEEDKT